MIAARRSTHRYRLQEQTTPAVLHRTCSSLLRRLTPSWPTVGAIVIASLWIGAMSIEGRERIAEEQYRAAQAIAERDALAEWHRNNTVKVVLEGSPDQVSRLARQFSELPQ